MPDDLAPPIVPIEEDPRALYVLGLVGLRAGHLGEAIHLLREALRRDPAHEGAQRNLVRALLAAGQPGETLAGADSALVLLPDCAELHFARGTALNALHQPAAARAALERSVALDPDFAPAWLNLGNACADLDEWSAAEAHVRRGLALDPSLAEAQASLGYLLTVQGRLAEADAACAAAIALRPDFVQAHWNRAVAALLAGDLPRGFAGYEWRKQHDRFRQDFIGLPGPVWAGDDPAGRTILVHAEQGFGDTIQFARYLPLIAARGGRPILACDPALVPFFAGMPDIQVVARGTALPPYDAWVDQMSLPLRFGTTLTTIPLADRYVEADSPRVAAWDAVLPPGRRVGIAWSGNPLHNNDRRRSLPPALLQSLLDMPRVTFVSLQVGPRARAVPGLRDLSPLLVDYAETAALVACLDLVIAVDTSVVHVAGALGVPTWVLLPHAPDWRWLLGRTGSPWYRSLRLFRQPRPGDWPAVMEAVAEALRTEEAVGRADRRGDVENVWVRSQFS